MSARWKRFRASNAMIASVGRASYPPPPPPLRFLEPRGIVKSRRRFSDPFAHPVSCGGILFEKSCFKNRVFKDIDKIIVIDLSVYHFIKTPGGITYHTLFTCVTDSVQCLYAGEISSITIFQYICDHPSRTAPGIPGWALSTSALPS